MNVPQNVRAFAAGLLLTLTVASIGVQSFTVEAHPAVFGKSIAQESLLLAQAPVVRDHRTPRPAQGVASPVVPASQTPQPAQAAGTPTRQSATAQGSAPSEPQPVSRLRLIIQKIIIHDDRDWGSGDISVNVNVWSREVGCRGGGCLRRLVEATFPEFQADSGDEYYVGRRIPAPGQFMADASISPDLGIPIYVNREYAFEIKVVDKDTVIDDNLGNFVGRINAQNGWGPPGIYTARGWIGAEATWDDPAPSGSPGDGNGNGHFSVQYEIRRARLPDLEPTGIQVSRPPGSTTDRVCVNVLNREVADAGPFQVAFSLEGPAAPTSIGAAIAISLASGQHTALCVNATLPTTGQHTLVAVVDDQHRVVELNEANNTVRQAYTPSGLTTVAAVGNAAPSPASTASPAPTSSAAGRPAGTPTPTATPRAGAPRSGR